MSKPLSGESGMVSALTAVPCVTEKKKANPTVSPQKYGVPSRDTIVRKPASHTVKSVSGMGTTATSYIPEVQGARIPGGIPFEVP